MSDDDDICSIVIDNGSYRCQAGFAGDDAPRSIFHSLVGRLRNKTLADGKHFLDSYVGDRAQCRRGILSLRRPIENGVIKYWDDMETVWDYIFKTELRVNPSEREVLLTEPLLNPKRNREKMMELMFETFQTPSFYVSTDGTLAIYASGRGTAMSIGVGQHLIQAYPVYEGYTFKEAHTRSALGGSDVSNYLRKLLYQRGCYFTDTVEQDLCDDMKQRVCYAASDFDEEMRICNDSSIKDASYELPDGNIIRVGEERSRAVEALFNPSLVQNEAMALQDVIQKCFSKCDVDTRRDLYFNIVLFGGSTMFPGIAERLTKELCSFFPKNMKIKVIAPPERKNSVWIGGSILASLSTFNNCKIRQEEYNEVGSGIVHQKCFS